MDICEDCGICQLEPRFWSGHDVERIPTLRRPCEVCFHTLHDHVHALLRRRVGHARFITLDIDPRPPVGLGDDV